MKTSERAAELRRLIIMLVDLIQDERKLEEIYRLVNRIFCR